MTDIFQKLANCCTSGINNYNDVYTQNLNEVIEGTYKEDRLTSSIKVNLDKIDHNSLKFALTFNDLSIITLTSSKQATLRALKPEWLKDQLDSNNLKFTIEKSVLQEHKINLANTTLQPILFAQSNELADSFLKEIRPFIENSSSIIQPERALMYLDKVEPSGRKHFSALQTTPNSPMSDWKIEKNLQRQAHIDFTDQYKPNQKPIYQIIVPYIKNLDYVTLSKIVQDEKDIISSLRSSINKAINQHDNIDHKEFVLDVIQPEIDMLNRKFKLITNMHSLKVAGASIGSVAMSFSLVMTGNLPFMSLAGPATLGALTKVYTDYKKDINGLKENPYYFLWKCKKVIKHKKTRR